MLLCKFFGHKWKQEDRYSDTNPRYVCERCNQKAVGILTNTFLGDERWPAPNIKVMDENSVDGTRAKPGPMTRIVRCDCEACRIKYKKIRNQPLAPWCKKHKRKYRTYFSGARDCPDCIAERIADIHRLGGNLREDI